MNAPTIHKISSAFLMRYRDGEILASRKQSPFFLHQGDIDLGCGTYCALMGLVIHGLLTAYQSGNIAASNRRVAAAFWQEASEYFFYGANGADIAGWLRRSSPMLKVSRIASPIKLMAAIDAGNFAMARLESKSGSFDHWVVVSGIQGHLQKGSFKTNGLLVLDPLEPAPKYCFYNGILEFGRVRHSHRYARNGRLTKVAIGEALIFQDRSAR